MTVTDAQLSTSGAPGPDGEERHEQERRLHQRVIARDERALLELFDRTAELVFCAALLLSGETSLAEDWTEAVFVELWNAPEAFPPGNGPLGLQMVLRLTDRVLLGRAA